MHTPPAQDEPAGKDVAPHTPAVHTSVVHALPSLQSAAPKHCTQTRVEPDTSQNGAPSPHPLSRPRAESFVQGTHTGTAPDASQKGVAPPHPLSVVVPVRSSTQV